MDASTFPWELSQDLGGLVGLSSANGMLFDLGLEEIVEIATMPMLFSLDIAFLAENMTVTEIYQNVQPGYLVTSQIPARYFLEVNASELDGIEPGILVSVEYLVTDGMTSVASDQVSAMVPFIGFLTVSAVSILIMRDMVKDDSFFDSVVIHRLGPNLSIYHWSELKALE